jgi:hypothetical protein
MISSPTKCLGTCELLVPILKPPKAANDDKGEDTVLLSLLYTGETIASEVYLTGTIKKATKIERKLTIKIVINNIFILSLSNDKKSLYFISMN